MTLSSTGKLVIIGGAEDKKDDKEILREFVTLAGGASARLVIMTVATEHPVEVGNEYLKVFRELMGDDADLKIVDVEQRDEANLSEAVDKIKQATGVFFTGGDQFRITRFLGGTRLDTALHTRFEDHGLVIAGTSAGASMMSSIMIIQGPATTAAKIGMTWLGAGMEFLPGVIIDQHFAQRGRINRLISAIAQYPHHLGVGIDENTAMIVEGHIFRVIGEGSITVVDAGSVSQGIPAKHCDETNLAIGNVKLHLLPKGHGFDLRRRTPLFDLQANKEKTQ